MARTAQCGERAREEYSAERQAPKKEQTIKLQEAEEQMPKAGNKRRSSTALFSLSL